MARIITRCIGDRWIAFRAGDERGGARGYGDTPDRAIVDLEAHFPDDGPAEIVAGPPTFSAAAHARILGASVADLRRKLTLVATEKAQ